MLALRDLEKLPAGRDLRKGDCNNDITTPCLLVVPMYDPRRGLVDYPSSFDTVWRWGRNIFEGEFCHIELEYVSHIHHF